jgi:hypothetical protein
MKTATSDLARIEKAFWANVCDGEVRSVYADALEDEGRAEDAARVRGGFGVKYNGRWYDCEVQAKVGGEGGYLLRGPKGAIYGLGRNVHKPHLLFTMNMAPGRFGVLKGWFRDDGPEGLRQIG